MSTRQSLIKQLHSVYLLVGVDVNLADKKRRNALFYAVEWRHAAAASFLLERGSDVACDCDGRYGYISFNSI